MLVGYPMVPGSRRYRDIEPTMCIQTCTETHRNAPKPVRKRLLRSKNKNTWASEWLVSRALFKFKNYQDIKLYKINCLPSKGTKKIPSNNPHQSHGFSSPSVAASIWPRPLVSFPQVPGGKPLVASDGNFPFEMVPSFGGHGEIFRGFGFFFQVSVVKPSIPIKYICLKKNFGCESPQDCWLVAGSPAQKKLRQASWGFHCCWEGEAPSKLAKLWTLGFF